MTKCDYCMKKPFHSDKKCCFNCARDSTDCKVWHDCGEDCPGWKNKVVTNADKIRAMTDEELATFLETFGCCHYCSEHHRLGGARFYSDEKCGEHCQDHLLDWLKQPAEVDDAENR